MKKYLRPFRNKYIFTLTVFFIYNMFLDDVDVFSVISQNRKISQLKASQSEISIKLNEVNYMLMNLKDPNFLEKIAREDKLFKKDDEDIFIITYK
jgi:cell division protein FtsB